MQNQYSVVDTPADQFVKQTVEPQCSGASFIVCNPNLRPRWDVGIELDVYRVYAF